MTNHPSECTPVSGRNLSLLTLGLYSVPIGESSLRACAAALGSDQFDGDDPTELPGKISFFNWYEFCISLGGFLGIVFLVWAQDSKGWGLGFALPAVMVLVGTVAVAAGSPFYPVTEPGLTRWGGSFPLLLPPVHFSFLQPPLLLPLPPFFLSSSSFLSLLFNRAHGSRGGWSPLRPPRCLRRWFYRHQKKPTGSPLTSILQVFVAVFRKRKLPVPENLMEMHQAVADGTATSVEFLQRTTGFKFLDKAAVDDGDRRRWSLCTVTQVEEAKIILRMLPVFLSSVLAYIPFSLLLSLTVQQGGTMDTRLGAISIPPGSLFVVAIVFQMLTIAAYDRAVVPWLRRATGYAGGVTHLQRVGVGFASSVVALATAAAVEARRRSRARAAAAPAMSAFWLTPQYFFISVLDVTSYVGLLEFFSSEASAGMKSMGTSVVFCISGVGAWLGSLLIQVVNRATAAHGGGGHGWLDGASLDASRLDLFYWLLAVLEFLSFFLYLLCSWKYTYRHDPRMPTTMDDDKVSPASTKQATVDGDIPVF